MRWFICLLAVIVGLAPSSSYATQCDQFSFGQLCSLSPISSIIDLVPGLEDEQQCQDQCVLSSDCNYFTFVKFANTSSDCFLLRECQNKTFCADTLDCAFAIVGPKTPPVRGLGEQRVRRRLRLTTFTGSMRQLSARIYVRTPADVISGVFTETSAFSTANVERHNPVLPAQAARCFLIFPPAPLKRRYSIPW